MSRKREGEREREMRIKHSERKNGKRAREMEGEQIG